MKLIFFCLSFFMLGSGFAQSVPTKAPSAEQIKKMTKHNQSRPYLGRAGRRSGKVVPYAEYEPAKYILFSDRRNFNSTAIKDGIAENLPDDTILVVLSHSKFTHTTYDYYSKLVPDVSRLRVVYVPNHGFWARDALPIPVFKGSGSSKRVGLVDARYYHNKEPDEDIAELFQFPLQSHGYYFEGGNFISDTKGQCFMIRNTNLPSDAVFKDYYGCTKIVKLTKRAGIGHIDERIKFLSDKEAITDTKEYVEVLEDHGFNVRLVPRPRGVYATYVNSLLVNGTVFLPVFGQTTDDEVQEIYESYGFKVVPVPSSYLSENGLGSVHCITMSYPLIDEDKLLEEIR